MYLRKRYLLYNMHFMQKDTQYIGETGRRLGDRFPKHLRDVERNDKDASEPVARHFNLPNHSSQHITICGLSLHQGNTEGRKKLEQIKILFSNRHT